MPFTALPIAPNTERPASFASEMDAFLAAMVIFRNELVATGSAYGVTLIGTSATSLTIGTGSKSITASTGMSYNAGAAIIVASTASPANRMLCTVTSYDSGTGALVVNADSVSGSGTFAAWSIGPTSVASYDGQTYTDLRLAGKFTEAVYAITGTTPVLDPANGTIQTWTLSATSTPTANFASGQAITIAIDDGTAYSIVWTSCAITWVGAAAPVLATSGKTLVELFSIGSTLYGAFLGYVA